MLISTYQAATKLHCAHETVRRFCLSMDIPKVGRDYVIDDASLARLRDAIQEKPGRPRK